MNLDGFLGTGGLRPGLGVSVLAALALATLRAADSRIEALAVAFEAMGLLAVASFL